MKTNRQFLLLFIHFEKRNSIKLIIYKEKNIEVVRLVVNIATKGEKPMRK